MIGEPFLPVLPLTGRNVYTILITLPGLTADGAMLLAGGLGVAINGELRIFSASPQN